MQVFQTDTVQRSYRVKFNKSHRGKLLRDMNKQLLSMFTDVLKKVSLRLHPNDLIRIVIDHPDVNGVIVVSLRKLHELDAQTIVNVIQNVLNSHEELRMDQAMTIDIATTQIPRGGYGRLRITSLDGANNSVYRKRSLVQIINNDQLCMARAIGVAWAKDNCLTTREW